MEPRPSFSINSDVNFSKRFTKYRNPTISFGKGKSVSMTSLVAVDVPGDERRDNIWAFRKRMQSLEEELEATYWNLQEAHDQQNISDQVIAEKNEQISCLLGRQMQLKRELNRTKNEIQKLYTTRQQLEDELYQVKQDLGRSERMESALCDRIKELQMKCQQNNFKDSSQKLMELLEDESKRAIDEALLLIKRGADVNFQSPGGATPLIFTCGDDDLLDYVIMLLKNGADVNQCSNLHGITPLIRAIKSEAVEVVKELIAHGARLDTVDGEGKCALAHAFEGRNTMIAQILMECGAKLRE